MKQPVPAPKLPPDLAYLLETYCIGRKLGGGSFGTVSMLPLALVLPPSAELRSCSI